MSKNFIPKHGLAYFSSPDAPTPRNYTTELQQILEGQRLTAGPRFEMESQYQPLYGQLGLDNQARNMFGFDDAEGRHHPGSLELQRSGTNYQRGGDISDLIQYGPASTQAFLAANPYLRTGLNEMLGRLPDSGLLRGLNAQAQEGLDANGQLSAQDERNIAQGTRRAYSDRGNFQGNQAIGAELLNRDAAVRARQAQAQALAGQVQGMNQQQADYIARASQIFGTQLSDPVSTILGRNSGAGGNGGNYPQLTGTGATLFNPSDPFAADIFNSNYNAEAASNIAQSNAQNATTGAIVSGVGSLLGGLLSDERLKEKVKDTGEKTKSGVAIKEFQYTTDKRKRRYRAVMAQELEDVNPDAVKTDPVSGLKVVDYTKTDAPFHQIVGKGKNKRIFNIITGDWEKAA